MLNTIMHEKDKHPNSNQNSIIDSSNEVKVTPPAKYEPRVHSERKKGKSAQEHVTADGSYRNSLVLKLHETEANCTFGVINNNSVEKGPDAGSQ